MSGPMALAVEMASVPSYALAGLLKGRKASSEAALKYAVYGAGAAGIMLYGISLLAGLLLEAPGDHVEIAGQGLRDMTRIAGSNPALWTEILATNAQPVGDVRCESGSRNEADRLRQGSGDGQCGPEPQAEQKAIGDARNCGINSQEKQFTSAGRAGE